MCQASGFVFSIPTVRSTMRGISAERHNTGENDTTYGKCIQRLRVDTTETLSVLANAFPFLSGLDGRSSQGGL
jgi:hypothetical protein